jgi:hypothetical protein
MEGAPACFSAKAGRTTITLWRVGKENNSVAKAIFSNKSIIAG